MDSDSVFFHRSTEAARPQGGPLQGLNVAIQPNISVAGWPTDAGSKALVDFTALEDATLVQRMIQAGAFLCGSTRMSEFGFGLEGSRAGGALRNGAANVELVLDLVGETRLAAARSALCGFKPSYGLVSRCGLVGLIPSMECCGLLANGLGSIREILRVIAGPDERDFSLPDERVPDFSAQEIDPRKTTAGIVTEAMAALPPERRSLFQAMIGELDKSGFSIREMSLPDFPLFPVIHQIIGSVEASSCAGRYDSVRYGRRAAGARNWNDMYLLSRGAAFGALLKGYLFQGAFFQFERYTAFENACRIRARLLAEMNTLASQADFLFLPVADAASSGSPASLAHTYAQFASTAFANITGQPALYLPLTGPDLTGVQLTGPRLSDARLLALGEHLLDIFRGGR